MNNNLSDMHILPGTPVVERTAKTPILLYPTPKIISQGVTLPESCHHENAQWRQTTGGI